MSLSKKIPPQGPYKPYVIPTPATAFTAESVLAQNGSRQPLCCQCFGRAGLWAAWTSWLARSQDASGGLKTLLLAETHVTDS